MKTALILLAIAVLIALAWAFLRKSNYEPAIPSTYTGDPFAYDGNKTLVVAVYAPWASVWRATEPELAKLDLSKYDLRLVSADREAELARRFGGTIVPTVYVFQNGKIVKTLPNLMRIEDVH